MNLSDIYSAARPAVSFELFPPKSDAGMNSLFHDMKELMGCHPAYVTCTYGAGGSTRDTTLEVLRRLRSFYPALPVASHLTCVGATADEIRAYLRTAEAAGVSYVVALRGDPPQGETTFRPVAGGLSYGSELVSLIHSEFPNLGVLVGGYPEKHPEAPSLDVDIEHLKRKVDNGADAVITQLFYDNEDFLRWRDRCAKAGITAPIVPGLLPVTNLAQVKRITSLCGARLPEALLRRLERHDGDDEGQYSVGVYWAARQADGLIEAGVPGIHFYVLNKSRAAALICRALCL